MIRIAVINQKGGVGKTTTTVNLGAALARQGYRVLLVDMDPQANLTVHLDRRPELEEKTLTDLLVDEVPLADLVRASGEDNLSLVAADTSLAGVEQVLANRIGRETILKEALEAWPEAESYDFLLLDCPPSLGVLSANALVASDRILIPMQAEYLALQGMAKLLEVIQLVQRRLNPELSIACILPCMVDQRTNLSAEVLAEIEGHFGRLLARTFIRSNVKLAEAPSFGRTIFEHAPESNGAQDYKAFAEEFLTLLSAAEDEDVGEGELEDEGEELGEAAAEPASPEPEPAGGDATTADGSGLAEILDQFEPLPAEPADAVPTDPSTPPSTGAMGGAV